MRNFISSNKIIITIVVCTLAIIITGVSMFSAKDKKIIESQQNSDVVFGTNSQSIKTDGINVTLVEFGDYQCPSCGAYHPLIKRLLKDYKGQFNFVFRNFPLVNSHKNALLAAKVAESAGLQNKFWEMHDKLYENQRSWSNLDDAQSIFDQYASGLKLDLDKFHSDINSKDVNDKINKDLSDGDLLGVSSTPTFYINNTKIALPGSYEEFETILKAEIIKSPKLSDEDLKYHIHFDLKIFNDSKMIDLSSPIYQSEEGSELSEAIHLHDGNGDVVHIHKKGQKLIDLTNSLKLELANYKVIVNGSINASGLNYEPQDLDQILITNSTDYQKELTKLTDIACIYSERCPERGKPPTENCVGGLGTGCD